MEVDRAQFSWTWSLVVSSIGLFFTYILWIVINEVRNKMAQPILDAGANPANMVMFDSLIEFAPVILLLSWGMFTLIVANATKQGDAL